MTRRKRKSAILLKKQSMYVRILPGNLSVKYVDISGKDRADI